MSTTHNLSLITTTTPFYVQIQSNDDVSKKFIDQIQNRLIATSFHKPDLFAILCPSIETNNDCREILRNTIFSQFSELNFYLLKYKWDHNAELNINNIINILSEFHNSNFYIIDSDFGLSASFRTNTKLEQIKNSLRTK